MRYLFLLISVIAIIIAAAIFSPSQNVNYPGLPSSIAYTNQANTFSQHTKAVDLTLWTTGTDSVALKTSGTGGLIITTVGNHTNIINGGATSYLDFNSMNGMFMNGGDVWLSNLACLVNSSGIVLGGGATGSPFISSATTGIQYTFYSEASMGFGSIALDSLAIYTNNLKQIIIGNNTTTFTSPVRFNGTNTTGSGAALLGANSPAGTLTAPYTWIKVYAADGTVCYMPAWK